MSSVDNAYLPISNTESSRRQWEVTLFRRLFVCLRLHWENSPSISFQIEWDMIVVIVFLSNFEPNGILFGFPFNFWTKWNSIWFKIERKTVTAMLFHSTLKELEFHISEYRNVYFSFLILRNSSEQIEFKFGDF